MAEGDDFSDLLALYERAVDSDADGDTALPQSAELEPAPAQRDVSHTPVRAETSSPPATPPATLSSTPPVMRSATPPATRGHDTDSQDYIDVDDSVAVSAVPVAAAAPTPSLVPLSSSPPQWVPLDDAVAAATTLPPPPSSETSRAAVNEAQAPYTGLDFERMIDVKLERRETGSFGFSLTGGLESSDFPAIDFDEPLVVVSGKHPAKGDNIVKINGKVVLGHQHDVLVDAISSSPLTMTLSLIPAPPASHSAGGFYTLAELFAHPQSGSIVGRQVLNVTRAWLNKCIVPVTTRPMRAGEEDGAPFFFLTLAEFEDMVTNKKMIEYSRVGQAWYGTPCYGVLKRDPVAAARGMKDKARRGTYTSMKYALHKRHQLMQQAAASSPGPGAAGVTSTSTAGVDFSALADVTLRRIAKSGKFGFLVSGGLDSSSVPQLDCADALLLQVVAGMRPTAGDNIVRINGQNVLGKCHDELVAMVAASGEFLTFSLLPRREDSAFISLWELLAGSSSQSSIGVQIVKEARIAIYAAITPVTTRAPRPGERNGVQYEFVSSELCVAPNADFSSMVDAGDFLEHSKAGPTWYGTPKYGLFGTQHPSLPPVSPVSAVSPVTFEPVEHATVGLGGVPAPPTAAVGPPAVASAARRTPPKPLPTSHSYTVLSCMSADAPAPVTAHHRPQQPRQVAINLDDVTPDTALAARASVSRSNLTLHFFSSLSTERLDAGDAASVPLGRFADPLSATAPDDMTAGARALYDQGEGREAGEARATAQNSQPGRRLSSKALQDIRDPAHSPTLDSWSASAVQATLPQRMLPTAGSVRTSRFKETVV